MESEEARRLLCAPCVRQAGSVEGDVGDVLGAEQRLRTAGVCGACVVRMWCVRGACVV